MAKGRIEPGKFPPDIAEKIDAEKRRTQVVLSIVHHSAIAVWIAASALPIWVVAIAVKEFAGRETKVNIAVTAVLTLAGVAGVVRAWFLGASLKAKDRELIRLRERCKILEERKGKGKP